MTRKKLEQLVWKHKHRDFKGVFDGSKMVLKNCGGQGTCLVPLGSLTIGELVHSLPRTVREAEGIGPLWRVVTAQGGLVLGVFGEALVAEAEACARRVVQQTEFAAEVLLFVGKRPAVGALFVPQEALP